jgi:hypothetical protein
MLQRSRLKLVQKHETVGPKVSIVNVHTSNEWDSGRLVNLTATLWGGATAYLVGNLSQGYVLPAHPIIS